MIAAVRSGIRLRTAALGLAIVAGSALAVGTRAVAQQAQNFDNVEIDVVPVRGGVYIQVGDEGVMVIDTQFAPLSGKIVKAIQSVSDKPIRYVVNTHVHGDHVGGNEALAKAGRTRAGGNVVGDIGAAATDTARILAHENVLNRMVKATGQAAVPRAMWPTETFFTRKKEMLFNDEGVQFIHQPAAHTDGDIVVFFRRSDVVATGDLFTTVIYPFIDTANGGTINGYITALNAILDITIPSNVNEGGTMVVPGHGRLSDEQDVIEYRDMATIVRDRIREYVKRGMTLEQVKSRKPTLDFDPRYGADSGFWTTAMFIETVYREMSQERAAQTPKTPPARNRTQNPSQGQGSGR
jgi:glyoxylase-like metal-dependent hydrolase (beta-lactamase superfamily II)